MRETANTIFLSFALLSVMLIGLGAVGVISLDQRSQIQALEAALASCTAEQTAQEQLLNNLEFALEEALDEVEQERSNRAALEQQINLLVAEVFRLRAALEAEHAAAEPIPQADTQISPAIWGFVTGLAAALLRGLLRRRGISI